MRIGLIDVDGHNYPNLPLMKLSAWHKQRGDSVEWYSPMFSGHMDRVYMSKVFSFSNDFEYFVDADEIIKGGSGYCITLEDGKEVYHKERDMSLPPEVEHIYPDYNLYPVMTKDTAYGFLSRGCPRGCGFCHVKAKEGGVSYKVADLSEFWRGQKNIELLDPNLLACRERLDLLIQLADSGSMVNFSQGLDIRLMDKSALGIIKHIRLKAVHFAFDRYQDKDLIVPRLKDFAEQTGLERHTVSVYILCNYDTTLEQDLWRIYAVRALNLHPYPMIYDKAHCNKIYRHLQRWCNSFAILTTPRFEDYLEGVWWKGDR